MTQEITAKILSEKEQILSDSLENLVAQLGTENDKRSHSRFVNNRMLSAQGNEAELNALYRTEWIAGKVVDIIPDDMTREGRDFTGDILPETIKLIREEEDTLQLWEHFNLAHKWARLFGTGFIVMDIDDGQTPDKPLNINAIKKGGLRHIKSIDRYRLSHKDIMPVIDPLNPNFGMPEYYRFNETATVIHHSRMLRFDGVKIPYDEFKRNNYFHDSVLGRLYDPITNYTTTANGSASMVYEANVDIVKIKGLMGYLQTPEGENLLRKRFALANLLKSFNNMLLLDAEEDFQTKTNSFAGLKDLLMAHALFLSGASDIPATRMLGSSASGLNATGEGDLKNYYDAVRSTQTREYKPKLDYWDKIMIRHLGLSEDTDMGYVFTSLFQITPKEKSELEFIDAQRDAIYLDRSIIPEVTVAKELKQNEVYTNIDDEYIAILAEAVNGEDDDDGIDTDTGQNEVETKSENEGGKETGAKANPEPEDG